ncbi:MAG: hypothetical protein KF684_00705 [Phycisphaeraceae bacterium]|nr:hypothetical protein [Phycisphaeraceae bacterium]
MELLIPIIVLAIGVAAVRVIGIVLAKPGKVDRVYTKPVISGSWGVAERERQRQEQQKQQQQPTDTNPSESNA